MHCQHLVADIVQFTILVVTVRGKPQKDMLRLVHTRYWPPLQNGKLRDILNQKRQKY